MAICMNISYFYLFLQTSYNTLFPSVYLQLSQLMALLFYFTEKIQATRRELSHAPIPNLPGCLHQYTYLPFGMNELASLHWALVSLIFMYSTLYLTFLFIYLMDSLKMSKKEFLLPLHYQDNNKPHHSSCSPPCPGKWQFTSSSFSGHKFMPHI